MRVLRFLGFILLSSFLTAFCYFCIKVAIGSTYIDDEVERLERTQGFDDV